MIDRLKRATRKLASWYVDWAPWIAGVLLLFCLAFFGGILCVGAGSFLSHPVTIQWATAIATVLAAVVAVGVAVHGQQTRRREASEQGAFLMASTTSWLNLAGASSAGAKDAIGEILKSPNTLNNLPDRIRMHVAEELISCLNYLERIPLSNVANHDKRLAAHIATALDHSRLLSEALRRPGGNFQLAVNHMNELRCAIQTSARMAHKVHTKEVLLQLTDEDRAAYQKARTPVVAGDKAARDYFAGHIPK